MTLKRKNAEMDRNPAAAAAAAANNYSYYKDPMNYVSPNTTYSDIYQLTYPFEDELKEKRYQLPTATGPTYQQSQPTQQQLPHAQPLSNIQYSQNYSAKTDYHQQPAYKATCDKTQSVINPYANYTYPNYKDNGQYAPPQASYYDQYKFNMSLGTTPTNYGKTSKDTNYHQNFSPGLYTTDPKLGTVPYCEEATHAAKSSIVKPPANGSPQMSQYPMYPNCYGYPTPTSFPNQNYCSYAQSCSEDARILWDEYPASRRLMSTYVGTQPAAPPANAQSIPAQARIKTNYNGDYYGSNTAYHAYHAAEGVRNREKLMYPMNSHVPTENMYNSRTRCLPMDYKYHQAVPQNMMMAAYDPRYNFVGADGQNYDYCSQRQDNGSVYHHPAYGKSNLGAPPTQKHIRPPGALPNDYCNVQPYYVCNDQMGVTDYHQDPYGQQCIRNDPRYSMSLGMNMAPGVPRSMAMPNDIMTKDTIYTQPLDAPYYTQNNVLGVQGTLPHNVNGSDKSKSTLGKEQNLREFLATWNEDEEDGCEKVDENENQLFLQQTNIEVENSAGENHLQFKGSFNTRPKIHVGITVDSNVASNQYINLPDIIIDIEKPKETDLISHSIGTTQNGASEKLVLLESVDIPVNELAQYTNINLLDTSIEGLDTLPANTVVATDASNATVVASSEEIIKELSKEVLGATVKEAIIDEVVIGPVVGPETISLNEESSVHTNNSCFSVRKRTSKEKRRKRVHRLRATERTKSKCRLFGRIIKSRSGKLIRIRKMAKRTKRRHIMSSKKLTTNAAVTIGHSNEETEKLHSSYNPKTLKDICIGFFNSQKGWDSLLGGHNFDDVEGEKDALIQDEVNEQETKPPSSPSSTPPTPVPKLSALCENALNSFYEEKNILLLNLDDLDSNLYFIECDINENVVNAGEDNLNANDFIELFIDDEMDAEDATTSTNISKNNCENVDDKTETLENHTDANDDDYFNSSSWTDAVSTNNNNNNNNDDHSNILDNSLAEICLTSDENSRDFSALHHEEIVPDNLHAYKNEKLLKYLQNKYTYKSNYLKIFIVDKICKKYRKYVLKRRKNQKLHHHHQQQQIKNQISKKLLVSKLKEKFIKRSKHLKIGSNC